eukprot:scaffold160309_cov57-Attheya_sp.AAC.6
MNLPFANGHIILKAKVDGAIVLVKNGDPIRTNVRSEAQTIDFLISDKEWEEFHQAWSPPPL